jgi:glutamate racemase
MIGIFDSGVGGLTVAKQVFQYLPEYKVIYFGDTARAPYGVNSAEVIMQYALEDMEFLMTKGVSSVLIACNTVSAVAFSCLNEFDLPVFDVIAPAVKGVIAVTENNKVGIMCTAATATSRAHLNLFNRLAPCIQVNYIACPLLVGLAEQNIFEGEVVEEIVKSYVLELVGQGVDTIVLGCTHFPHFRDLIQKYAGEKIILVDPAEYMIADLKAFLENNNEKKSYSLLGRNDRHEFYVSGEVSKFYDVYRKALDFNISNVRQAKFSRVVNSNSVFNIVEK